MAINAMDMDDENSNNRYVASVYRIHLVGKM